MIEQKAFSGWAYITRAEDVPGCWVAHCLDYDIMSVGTRLNTPSIMVREAVGIALADDLNHGLDPHARRASAEDWAPLLRLFERHTKIALDRMDETTQAFREFAAPLTVVLVAQPSDDLAPKSGLDIDSRDALVAA